MQLGGLDSPLWPLGQAQWFLVFALCPKIQFEVNPTHTVFFSLTFFFASFSYLHSRFFVIPHHPFPISQFPPLTHTHSHTLQYLPLFPAMAAAGASPMNLMLMSLFVVLFLLHGNGNAMSTITAMSKDQIACSMCYSCDNPCQPILSPPPTPPPSPPPPPPPPPPAPDSYYCPPPPSPPPTDYCPPPPSNTGDNYSPPPSSGGSNYYPPPPPQAVGLPKTQPSLFPFQSPPNPLVPYFPYYYYPPPPPAPNNAIKLTKPTNSLIFLLLILAPFFIFHI